MVMGKNLMPTGIPNLVWDGKGEFAQCKQVNGNTVWLWNSSVVLQRGSEVALGHGSTQVRQLYSSQVHCTQLQPTRTAPVQRDKPSASAELGKGKTDLERSPHP